MSNIILAIDDMTNAQVQQHPASVDSYIRHGWSIVPIPPGTKGPVHKGWNLRENTIQSQHQLPAGYGIGIAHAYSGTMALDIDNIDIATVLLQQHGINLTALFDADDAVIIQSGKPGHGKLLYAMPFGLTLPSRKIRQFGVTVYELRCATTNGTTVQDVLPPSIHPETRLPYRWAGRGHWTRLPTLPSSLVTVWQNLLDSDTVKRITTDDTSINTSWDEIREALYTVPPDCTRDEWINIGMALHWAGSQTGDMDIALQLWHDWSATAQVKYPGERAILQQWSSLRTDKSTAVKLGTLFHIARQHGWTRPLPDITGMFSATSLPTMTPADISLTLRPPAPDIDLSLWPPVLAKRAAELSDSVGCDPLVPLFAGLAAVCGVVDARSRLELMPGYRVPPVLWLMTIGDPADKKSPGSRPMLSPLKQIELEDRPRYSKELLDWEAKEAAYASAKKTFLEFAASPDMLLNEQAPPVPDLPARPVALKITVGDITSQKLVRQAADRPRGLLCHLDEMNAWVSKLTDKTSGEDRSAWVVSYESEPYEMDRVGAGSIHADNLAVSIYGNIQPDVYRANLSQLATDGLIQRFIPAVLRANRTRLGNPIPEYLTSADRWENTLRLIYALQPQTYKLSPDAFRVFREFQQWYEQAKQDERLLMSSTTFMTAFGKLEGTAGRLILIFHLIESPFDTTVDVDIVNRVIYIIKSYVIPAYRYALGEVGGVNTFDQWLADHVIHYCDKPVLTLAEIKRSARRQLEGKNPWAADQIVFSAMHTLERASWVIRIDDGSREHQHIAEWAVNPNLQKCFSEYRSAVIRAKQRVQDEIYKLAPFPRKPVHGATS